jgi:hypothetical protein
MRVGKAALQNNNHPPGLSLLATDLATVTGEGGSETKEARQACRGKHNAKRLQEECFLRSKSDWGTGQRPV